LEEEMMGNCKSEISEEEYGNNKGFTTERAKKRRKLGNLEEKI